MEGWADPNSQDPSSHSWRSNKEKMYSQDIEQPDENDTEIKQLETFFALNVVKSWPIKRY